MKIIKDNIKLILAVVGVVILVEALIAVIAAEIETHKYMNDDKEMTETDKYYYDNRDKVDLEMGRYVESKEYILKDGNILVEVINQNDYAGAGRVYIEFFDENNESITMQDEYFDYVGPGKKTYVESVVSEELQKLYKTYKVKVVLTYNSRHNRYYDNGIKLISFNEATWEIVFKNNTGKKLECVEWGFLYYDENGSIIDYSREYIWNVKKNKTVKDKSYLHVGEYSKIKAVLLEAYS